MIFIIYINKFHSSSYLTISSIISFSGILVKKFDNKVSIIASGKNSDYDYLNPLYFLYHNIILKYKENYDILDLNEIADDFKEDSIYKELNTFKIEFNPTITEYIGELDLVISDWRFKLVEKNNLLTNEFTKKKDIEK